MTVLGNGNDKFKMQLDDILNSYRNNLNINVPAPVNISNYLTMSRDEIEKCSTEHCMEIALHLSQYAIFLQQTQNRETARINWCTAKLAELMAPQWNNYDKYMPRDLKEQAIAKDSTPIANILDIKRMAQALVDEIDNLGYLVKHYSLLFKGIADVKRYQQP